MTSKTCDKCGKDSAVLTHSINKKVLDIYPYMPYYGTQIITDEVHKFNPPPTVELCQDCYQDIAGQINKFIGNILK